MESRGVHPFVLHIEDDDGDAHILVRTLAQASIPVRISRAADGQEALNFLKAIISGDVETPDLVFLDLNLPRVSGEEVLKAYKSAPQLDGTPIIVLTASPNVKAEAACRALGCDLYIAKPIGLDALKAIVDQIYSRYVGVGTRSNPGWPAQTAWLDGEPEPEYAFAGEAGGKARAC